MMNNKTVIKITFFTGMIILFCQCTPSDKELKTTLGLAGENRKELEKVLGHYSSPEDSLKYKAAVFLIKNMPYHLGYYSEKFDRYDIVSDSMYSFCRYKLYSKNELINRSIRKQIFKHIYICDLHKKKLEAVYPYDFQRRLDIKEIPAELLIENIDYAFKAWGFPWSKNYNFEQFCKYILPYRYGREPYESWRPFYMKQLSWILDSVKNPNDPLEIAILIRKWIDRNAYFNIYIKSLNSRGLKCSNFLKSFVTTTCDDRAGLSTCCMRSMGIPSAVVTFPKWGYNNRGHSIYAILNTDEKWHSINLGDDMRSSPEWQLKDYTVPKIFIKHFDVVQPKIDHAVYQRLPLLLHAVDITAEYIETVNVEIDIDPQTVEDQKFAFICVFDRPYWQPVFWGKIKHDKVAFNSMGVGMVYLPVVYRNNELVPISAPVKVSNKGNIQKIRIDRDSIISYSFNRKFPKFYPEIVELRCEDLVGGKFEVADNSFFNNSKIIYEIKDIPPYYPQNVKVNNIKAKYVRYCFPNMNRKLQDGPGQISFYTTQGDRVKRLEGKYFGSLGTTKKNLNIIFDDNILSFVSCYPYEATMEKNGHPNYIFYQCPGDSIWAGIEFDKEELITHVGYCPRNDRNGIYPGMDYELLYWDNEWNSLGIETAKDSTITYNNIPEGALLWLRNLDKGEAERICTIEDGKLVWW